MLCPHMSYGRIEVGLPRSVIETILKASASRIPPTTPPMMTVARQRKLGSGLERGQQFGILLLVDDMLHRLLTQVEESHSGSRDGQNG